MDYGEFVTKLTHLETSNIKVRPIDDICHTQPLPKEILTLFPEIINILEISYNLICENKQKIVIFGLQTAPFTITSELPKSLNRIFNLELPQSHLCCCIQYCITENPTLPEHDTLTNTHSMIVDFTTGEVADAIYYLDKILNKKSWHKPYGYLSKQLLTHTWTNLRGGSRLH